MKPKINKTSKYIEIIGHYDNPVLCAKLTLLADLYAIEHREGYAKFRVEDEDKLRLVDDRLEFSITNLTGTKWILNNMLQLLAILGSSFSINFTSNSSSFSLLRCVEGQDAILFDSTRVYTDMNSWSQGIYRIIEITGGTDTTNSNLISWLEINAIQIKLTNLTGTKWVFKDTIGYYNSDWYRDAPLEELSLNFSCNGQNYTMFDFYESASTNRMILHYDGLNVYEDSWIDSVYKMITITGGTGATSSDLIEWIHYYATQIIEPEITDLTGTKWLFNDNLTITSNQLWYVNGGLTVDYPETSTLNEIRLTYYSDQTPAYTELGYGAIPDAWDSDNGWNNSDFKSIFITGGTDATNADLIAWLQANATQIKPTYTISTTTNNCEITNVSFILTPNSGYQLPSNISVTNATLVSYNSTSGEVVLSGVSDNTSIDVEFDAIQLISFTVEPGFGTYQAESGMTWQQWINSAYNTDNYYIDGNTIRPSSDKYIYGVLPTDIISTNGAYQAYYE